MSRLGRYFQRLVIFLVAAATLWIIVIQVYDRLDRRIPAYAALLATYVIAAYVVIPFVARLTVRVLRRERIPRVTRAGDGLAADPVNIVLVGSEAALRHAFLKAGWYVADPVTPSTSLRMVASFGFDRPYPQAPFSPLYLFGRRQDIGFQQPVGNSPRRRHHIRFWAADADPEAEIADPSYWTRRRRIDPARSHIWVGSGTRDTGFGFQAVTYQISHSVDRHADVERDHIVASLTAAGAIGEARIIEPGAPAGSRFISDGRIVHAILTETGGENG